MKFLSKISNWGWKKGQEKDVALFEEATRDYEFDHAMLQMSFGWMLFLVLAILGLSGLSLAYAGAVVFQALQEIVVLRDAVAVIGTANYGFYLFWFIPAVLLGTTGVQLLLLAIPHLGNMYRGNDYVRLRAEIEGDKALMKQAENFSVSKEIILEKTKSIDLLFIRKKGVIDILKGFIVVTAVSLPFLFLSVNSFVALNESGELLISRFFQIGTEELHLDKIDYVDVAVVWEGDYLEPYYELHFEDGRSVDLWELGAAGTDIEDLKRISSFLKQQGVVHFIDTIPNLDSLNARTAGDVLELYQSLQENR